MEEVYRSPIRALSGEIIPSGLQRAILQVIVTDNKIITACSASILNNNVC